MKYLFFATIPATPAPCGFRQSWVAGRFRGRQKRRHHSSFYRRGRLKFSDDLSNFALSEFACKPDGNRPSRCGDGDVGHGVEVVAVGEVADAEVHAQVFAEVVASVSIQYQGGTPVVGAA